MSGAILEAALEAGQIRLLLWAMRGRFSREVFTGLLKAGLAPAVLVLPGYGGGPVVPPDGLAVAGGDADLATLAASAGLPVWYWNRASRADVSRKIEALRPDFMLTACFPEPIPADVRGLAASDCLNLHPSLLPAYRGPAPLFWQLHNGQTRGGISLHRMVDKMDAGPVIARASLALRAEAGPAQLDADLARAGVRLLRRNLPHYTHGQVAAEIQDESRASVFATPQAEDYRLHTDWTVTRAFRFMRGLITPSTGFPVAVGEREFVLRRALALEHGTRMAQPYAEGGGRLRLQFADGVLEAVTYS